MNISATYKGESVNIVGVTSSGQDIAISYIDGSDVLHIDKVYMSPEGTPLTIATNCTIIS